MPEHDVEKDEWMQEQSRNTIHSITRIFPGDEYTARCDLKHGDGYYHGVAEEVGYFLKLADSVVFITDDMLKRADEARANAYGDVECGDDETGTG